MGAAWCRERIEQAQNSKSPVDRLITRCSNAINAKTIYSKPNQSKPANDIVFKQIRYATSPPVPVHRAAPRRSHPNKTEVKPGEWQDIPLHVPEVDGRSMKTPVPPPRRRKKRKVNSLEVLSSQINEIYEASLNSRPMRPHSELFFGDRLPDSDDGNSAFSYSPDRSPTRSSPTKSIDNESKRKNRAKKIMESKTRYTKKGHFQPLSIAKNENDISKNDRVPSKMVKNFSTISLPSYQELTRHESKDDVDSKKSVAPRRNVSTTSLPGESVLTTVSGVTISRLEEYMRRCKSFGSLKPQQLLEKLEEITNKQESESSDSWSGLDDWDVGIIEYCDAENVREPPPLVPKSRIKSKHSPRVFELGPPMDQPDGDSFPAGAHTEISLSDNTFNMPHTTHDWFSIPAAGMIKMKTPPPTPEEGQVTKEEKMGPVEEDDPHSTLLKILSKYRDDDVEDMDLPPAPPRRKKSKEINRRQSYHYEGDKPPPSYSMVRSFSLDATLEEEMPSLSKTWQNIGFSGSRHSLSQALTEFLGFEDQPVLRKTPSLTEINLNPSLFPVIGLQDGDKGVPVSLPGEMEDDRKTPSPPPLPSSPPPTTPYPSSSQLSTHLSTT